MEWVVPLTAVLGVAVGIPLTRLAVRAMHLNPRVGWRVRIIVGAVTGTLFGTVGAWLGLVWELPAYLYLAGASVVLGVVDIAEKRLPNSVVYPSLIVLPLLLAAAAALDDEWPALLGGLIGAAALFALYFALAVISPGSIGMGDVKLAALIGLALGYQGWSAMLVGAALGFVIGGLVCLVALLTRKATLRSSLPFGPAMLAGMFLGLLAA